MNPPNAEDPLIATASLPSEVEQQGLHDALDDEYKSFAIYDRVLQSTACAEMIAVYMELREASLERRLPAFRRCVERRSQ